MTNTSSTQSADMEGFDPKFADFPAYIIGITKEIWEDRGLATLHDYYADDIIVRTPAGITQGNQNVIAATMATLSEMPDRTLFGEDVIHSGTAKEGMLSSHRLYSTATHHGGSFGPATGGKLHYRILADCHAINNQINDEWLIRDQGAIVRQLGQQPQDYARKQLAQEKAMGKNLTFFLPEHDIAGPYQGCGNDHTWGQKLSEILTRIMAADFRVIQQTYDRAANLFYPGGKQGVSHADADAFWMGLRASFPHAEFRIHHAIGRDDPLMPPRAAVRWSLDGRHDGWGCYGQPSNARVHIMGITHAEFGAWGLRREYTLFDEVAIWKQILSHQGD